MPRAVWTGSLAFGLVTIPARLYPAIEPKAVRFHLMDEHGRRVRYRRYVPGEERGRAGWEPHEEETAPPPPRPEPERGEPPTIAPEAPGGAETEIAFEDLMRGYETDQGVVLLGREDVESARPEPSRTIEIEDFVELADIDPVYFDKSYYVAPERGAEKPYALLLRAMEQASRVGIGRFVLRTKPHLVAIRPAGGVLGLETLFFGDEVRSGRDLVPGIDGTKVSERELQVAEMLIETLKTEWDPSSYSDTFREELLRRIGEKTPIPQVEEEPIIAGSRVEALMEALKASVEAAEKGERGRTRRRPA